jgi:hypothetical protein
MNAVAQHQAYAETNPFPGPASTSIDPLTSTRTFRQQFPPIRFGNPRWTDIRTFADDRGNLGVVENSDLEFDIRRIYYIYGAGSDTVRGKHAHKRLEQLIICMHGRCTITFHNGHREFQFILERPEKGVYVPPRIWRSIVFDRPDTVCCVLASRAFESDDYIQSFDEFLEFTHRANRFPD